MKCRPGNQPAFPGLLVDARRVDATQRYFRRSVAFGATGHDFKSSEWTSRSGRFSSLLRSASRGATAPASLLNWCASRFGQDSARTVQTEAFGRAWRFGLDVGGNVDRRREIDSSPYRPPASRTRPAASPVPTIRDGGEQHRLVKGCAVAGGVHIERHPRQGAPACHSCSRTRVNGTTPGPGLGDVVTELPGNLVAKPGGAHFRDGLAAGGDDQPFPTARSRRWCGSRTPPHQALLMPVMVVASSSRAPASVMSSVSIVMISRGRSVAEQFDQGSSRD